MNKQTNITCPRCNGRGKIDSFGHYANGICFECQGAGTVDYSTRANEFSYKYAEVKIRKDGTLVPGQESDDLASLAEAVEIIRYQLRDIPTAPRYAIIHTATGEYATRGEVAAARANR